MLVQGQLLAASPYESHLDERLFGPRASDFDPRRGDLIAISGVAGIGGIAGFAFGGGRYRCSVEKNFAMPVASLCGFLESVCHGCLYLYKSAYSLVFLILLGRSHFPNGINPLMQSRGVLMGCSKVLQALISSLDD